MGIREVPRKLWQAKDLGGAWMDFSPLWRLLIIAALAYTSGLLVGLSFLRGEIGPRRGVAPASAQPSTPSRRGRSRNRFRRWAQELDNSRRRVLEIAVISLWLIGIGMLLLWLVSSCASHAFKIKI